MNAQHASLKTIALLLLLGLSGCNTYVRSSRQSRRGNKKQEFVLPSKSIQHTTLEEALACKNYYTKYNNLELAAKYIEHALTLAKDHTMRGELILELADDYMAIDMREKACKTYNQFKVLYPGSKKIKYVHYQELVASHADSLASTKDQTKTKNTVQLGEQFLQEFADDTDYSEQVRHLLEQAYTKLLKHEVNTARFYLNKYAYDAQEANLKAAHRRIDFLLKEYAHHIENMHGLLHINDDIVTTPSEEYRASLAAVIAQLDAFIDGQVASVPMTPGRTHARDPKKRITMM